jgi:hypothetical protein
MFEKLACSFGLSATSQQYFSLRKNQPPAISQQYFSLRTNQHQSTATSQTNRLLRASFMVPPVHGVSWLRWWWTPSIFKSQQHKQPIRSVGKSKTARAPARR